MSVQIDEKEIVNTIPYKFTVWLGYVGNRMNNKFIKRKVRKILGKILRLASEQEHD